MNSEVGIRDNNNQNALSIITNRFSIDDCELLLSENIFKKLLDELSHSNVSQLVYDRLIIHLWLIIQIDNSILIITLKLFDLMAKKELLVEV